MYYRPAVIKMSEYNSLLAVGEKQCRPSSQAPLELEQRVERDFTQPSLLMSEVLGQLQIISVA